MKLILDGPRLRLRPIEQADLALGIELFTDPRVTKYAGGVQTEEQLTAEMPLYLRRGGGGCIGVWCVMLRETQEQLGTAALIPLPIDKDDTDWDLVDGPNLPDAEIEIGYFLKPAAWGKGFASEAARTLLDFAFRETPLQEIVAVTEPENTASQNVLRKAGFEDSGTRRAYAMELPGFRITRERWHRRRDDPTEE